MSQITVKSFAEQIDIGVEKLIQQLADFVATFRPNE